MIVVMRPGATLEDIHRVEERISELGFRPHTIYGQEKTVIGAVGDRKITNLESITILPGVEKALPIRKPYKLVGRELKTDKTVVQVGGVDVGGSRLTVVAGPCAVEGEEQLLAAARAVKGAGAHLLRGGAYKPRTSPYAFQGLEEEGLRFLARAREETGLPVVTEVLDTRDVEVVATYADILQVGARNMQNFRLLREVGQCSKPVLLKRGLAATVEEWLMAAEYIADAGNENIILCERGIRTYENATRNTLDLSAIPVVLQNSHLPILVDPSHGTGLARLVPSMARAACAAGADGLLVEVHPDPPRALCDGPQSLDPGQFTELMLTLARLAQAIDREI